MKLHFYKYSGAGNDFILMDNRNKTISLSTQQIKQLCDRHFGIGADGFMMLEESTEYDFHMVYFNSDGNESSMCGNGGRCITAFAKKLGLVSEQARFTAIDGVHESILHLDGIISLHMIDVQEVKSFETYFEIQTGSPHYVHYSDYVGEMNVKKEGALIRYSPKYKDQGINVNFVEKIDANRLFVRTYERGVEDETLSCGTGVTASAISLVLGQAGSHDVAIQTPGGKLRVSLDSVDGKYFQNIWLHGPAVFVFEGDIEVG